MKVVLLQDVKTLGKVGTVVDVSDGYAKNFLFQKKLAEPLSADKLNSLKLHNAALEKAKQEEKDKAKELAKRINDLTVEIPIKIGENGKPFGSVTTKEIADALAEKGVVIDKKCIVLKDAIKEVGDVKVTAKIYPEVAGTFYVKVYGKSAK